MSTPRVLVVRARPHGFDREVEFKSGLISIGWPVGCSFDGKGREQIGDLLAARNWRTELAISQIQNFVGLPSGSIILTPSTTTREIFVFVDSESYFYRPELEFDPGNGDPWGNPHTIRAVYLKSMLRDEFPSIVQRALNAARKTVTRFDKYSTEICASIDHGDNRTESSPCSATSSVKREVINSLRDLLKSSKEETRLQAALALKDLL